MCIDLSSSCVDDVDIKAVIRLLRDAIQKNYPTLSDAIRGCLKEVADQMYGRKLLSKAVQTSPTFNSVISEFEVTLQISENIQQLEKKCHQFFLCLSSQGGPAQEAALRLAKQWKDDINKQFNMSFMNEDVQETFTENSQMPIFEAEKSMI